MESYEKWDLKYEIDSMRQQLTEYFPITEPTTRQILLRILTLLDRVVMDGEKI